jgi:predicted N-formylglutamate amidohydrolase
MHQLTSVDVFNQKGKAPLVLVCEHASNFIPDSYENLGLSAELLHAHIAWDPGALALAETLASRLDAPLVAATQSRLIYDCNRPPEAVDAIIEVSEVHSIPGNLELTEAQRVGRIQQVYEPFHNALSQTIGAKLALGQSPLLVTVHSFTPVYKGQQRQVEIGVLHDSDARLADMILAAMSGYDCRRNEPYSAVDGVTHTLKKHGIENGLPNVMLEIRNDLIADSIGVENLSASLSQLLQKGYSLTASTTTYNKES